MGKKAIEGDVCFFSLHIWIADLSHSEGHVVNLLKFQLFLQSTWNTDNVMSDITLIAGAGRMKVLCRKVEAVWCGRRFTI